MFLGKKEISKNVMMNGTSEHDRSSCSSPRYLMESSPQHSPREEVSFRVWGSLFVHLLSSIIIFIQIHFSRLQITMFFLSFCVWTVNLIFTNIPMCQNEDWNELNYLIGNHGSIAPGFEIFLEISNTICICQAFYWNYYCQIPQYIAVGVKVKITRIWRITRSIHSLP